MVPGSGSGSRVSAHSLSPPIATSASPTCDRRSTPACSAVPDCSPSANPIAEAAAAWDSPTLVEGAWFRYDVTRMDDQQHALSGLLVAAGELGPVGG